MDSKFVMFPYVEVDRGDHREAHKSHYHLLLLEEMVIEAGYYYEWAYWGENFDGIRKFLQ